MSNPIDPQHRVWALKYLEHLIKSGFDPRKPVLSMRSFTAPNEPGYEIFADRICVPIFGERSCFKLKELAQALKQMDLFGDE